MDYVVQPGDTLWGIARRILGDPKLWRQIADDNQLHGRTRILVGDRLEIRGNALPTGKPALQPAAARTDDADARDRSQPVGPEHQPSLIPGRAYAFVLADEIDPTRRKVVRKVMVSERLASELSAQLGKGLPTVPNPERFGLHPGDPRSSLPIGRHAMGMKPSSFQSASNHPLGARRFSGQRFWIDVEKARAAGATFHETEEIVADLSRIAAKARRAEDIARISAIRLKVMTDREVLARGSIPAGAVKGSTAMALTRAAQGVQVIGFAMTAVDLGVAARTSVASNSVKPLGAEVVRQGGSWAATWAAMKVGAAAGALFGLETGPGAVAFAIGGAAIGGVSGYLGFDWVADHIHEN